MRFFITIKEPSTPEDFEAYYNLRWEVLRKPWEKPKGSEKDEMEDECIHAMALDESGNICGVIRLQNNGAEEGQIRYMAVKAQVRNKGVGSALIQYAEDKAKNKNLKLIVLHARENAVEFYLKNHYILIEKSYLMWNKVQHFKMERKL